MTWNKYARVLRQIKCMIHLPSYDNHQALILLRKKLTEEQVNIQDIIDFNILPYLLNHMSNPDYPQLNVVEN